jgi:excisionase family DNA binding protein
MERLLTAKQVCDKLQVAPHTLYRLLETGQIKATKVNRAWRIKQADLDAYLDRQGATEYQARLLATQPGDVNMNAGEWPDPRNLKPRVPHAVMAEIRTRMLPGGDLEHATLQRIATMYDMSKTTLSRYMRVYGYMCRRLNCIKPTVDNSNYCAEHSQNVPIVEQEQEQEPTATQTIPDKPEWLKVGTLVRWKEPRQADEYWTHPFHIFDVEYAPLDHDWMLRTPTGNWYLASSVEPFERPRPPWATAGQWVRWRFGNRVAFTLTEVEEDPIAPSGWVLLANDGQWHDTDTFVPIQPSWADVANQSFNSLATAFNNAFTEQRDLTGVVDPTPKSAPSAILEAAEAQDPVEVRKDKADPNPAPSAGASVAAVPDWAEDLFQAVTLYLDALGEYHTKLKEAAVLNYPEFRAELRAAEKAANEAYELLQTSYAYSKRNRA